MVAFWCWCIFLAVRAFPIGFRLAHRRHLAWIVRAPICLLLRCPGSWTSLDGLQLGTTSVFTVMWTQRGSVGPPIPFQSINRKLPYTYIYIYININLEVAASATELQNHSNVILVHFFFKICIFLWCWDRFALVWIGLFIEIATETMTNYRLLSWK